jgi:hypothetical protein
MAGFRTHKPNGTPIGLKILNGGNHVHMELSNRKHQVRQWRGRLVLLARGLLQQEGQAHWIWQTMHRLRRYEVFKGCVQDDERSHEATAIARGGLQMNNFEKLWRVVFLLACIVLALDLLYWRPQ